MLSPKECQIVVNLVEFFWQGGGVRSEQMAMDVHNLKSKVMQMSQNPAPAAPTPPAGDEKKCGKCGGDCSDCGDCGDEKKEVEEPKGPPKAKEAPKKAEG